MYQLLNFVVGKAILTGCSTKHCCAVCLFFVFFFNLVQSRNLIDLYCHKCIDDLLSFENIWSCNDALCPIFG